MSEELKAKLRETLEQSLSDLDTMWQNCDSGQICDMYRKRQEEIIGLISDLDLA